MKFSRLFAVPVFALVCLAGSNTRAAAQINISIGMAPVCPYGYYNYAPYQCAPFGYYGPEWFSGGVFYGAGPWFHGPMGFHRLYQHAYDPHFGYHGPFPVRGEHADWDSHRGWEQQFTAMSSNEVHHDNGNHYGQYKENAPVQ